MSCPRKENIANREGTAVMVNNYRHLQEDKACEVWSENPARNVTGASMSRPLESDM